MGRSRVWLVFVFTLLMWLPLGAQEPDVLIEISPDLVRGDQLLKEGSLSNRDLSSRPSLMKIRPPILRVWPKSSWPLPITIRGTRRAP